MRGRRPKPTKLKKLAGNPGKRPLNRREPKATGRPVCPDHLDAIARSEWERVAPLLTEMGVLASVDMAALGSYCAAYSVWVQAQLDINLRGLSRKVPMKGMVTNPSVRLARDAMDQMRKFMTEFGMTPSSRSRLVGSVVEKQEDNPFANIAAENRAIQ